MADLRDTYYCRYHPLEPATWMNPRTQEYFCSRCVECDELASTPMATGIIDAESLQYLGNSGDAVPFWDQFTHYLVFPLRWQLLLLWVPVWLMAGLMLCQSGSVPWVGAALALSGLSQIAYAVLCVTGDGQPLTQLTRYLTQIKPEILLGLIVAQVAPVAIFIAADRFGSGVLVHLAFVVGVLIMPAMLLSALIEPGTGMLSVQRWTETLNAIGWSYVLLVSYVILMAGLDSIAISLFYHELPDAVALPLIAGIVFYALVVFYRLLGGVLHQFQHRLGYLPDGKSVRKKGRQNLDRTEQTLDMLAKDARFDDLEKYLRQLCKQRPQVTRYQDLLGKLLLEKGDAEHLRQHADQLLDAVARAEDNSRLLFIYQSQQALIKDFKPSSPLVRFVLSQQLTEKSEHEAAARLLVNLHNEHPQFPLLGDAYWLLARLLSEELGQPEMAAQCAMFVYKTFPKHAEREAVEEFLRRWRTGRGE